MIKKQVHLAIYLALAIMLGVLEVLILPTTVIPGVKLGLANLVTLVVLYQYDAKSAIIISVLRVLTVSLIVGSLFSPIFIVSVFGNILSLTLMIVFYKLQVFSVIGVSVISAVGHIIGQVLAVVIVLSTPSIINILAFLVYIAIISGAINGYIAYKILKIIK